MDFSTAKKMALMVGAVFLLIMLMIVAPKMVETNDAGYYHIKQGAASGDMTVINEPGPYLQNFATISVYQVSDMYYFSKHEGEGDDSSAADPIKIQFNDGGTAFVSGSVKFRLSSNPDKQLLLHRDFKSYKAVQGDLIRQVVTEALIQTAPLMKAEESYSSRRSEFTSLAEDQIKHGIFETISKEFKEKDADGNEFIEREVSVRLDANGKPLVRKESPLSQYGIEVIQFVIKDIDFDDTIDSLIAKKKEAEQQKVVARANAERAKQDAITAREQGAAEIAKAKAAEDVEKIKAVTQAQKDFEVAQLDKKRAEETAKAEIVKGEALAKINALKVQAGLTPLERATIAKETAIGVAAELAKVQFPQMMIIGGSDKGGPLNPFDAVGLDSFMKISEKMANTHKEAK